jgi:class 3 adenylate cyclase
MSGDQIEFRVDFHVEVLSVDEGAKIATLKLTPDPRRYNEEVRDGRHGYFDRFSNTFIPSDVLFKDASRILELPIHHASPSVREARIYATQRREALRHELETGEYKLPGESAAGHKGFQAAQHVSFVSIDVCSSTTTRAQHGASFDRALAVVLREVATLVGQFQGTVLKMTGDGMIAFFDHPSLNTQSDLVANFCTSLPLLIEGALSPALGEFDLPVLSLRIGADRGEATLQKVIVPATGFETEEIRSDALNRAVKIQELAPPNSPYLGADLRDQLHIQYLERTELVSPISDPSLTGYRVYSIR